jgi:hypothetical protein
MITICRFQLKICDVLIFIWYMSVCDVKYDYLIF